MKSWADNGAFLFEVGGKSEGIYRLPPGKEVPVQLDWIDPKTHLWVELDPSVKGRVDLKISNLE